MLYYGNNNTQIANYNQVQNLQNNVNNYISNGIKLHKESKSINLNNFLQHFQSHYEENILTLPTTCYYAVINLTINLNFNYTFSRSNRSIRFWINTLFNNNTDYYPTLGWDALYGLYNSPSSGLSGNVQVANESRTICVFRNVGYNMYNENKVRSYPLSQTPFYISVNSNFNYVSTLSPSGTNSISYDAIYYFT